MRLQANAVLFLVVRLDRCPVVNHRDDDIAVVRGALLAHEKRIAVIDACVDHGIPVHREQEGIAIAKQRGGKRDLLLDVLLCEYRSACGDATDERKLDEGVAVELGTGLDLVTLAGLVLASRDDHGT